MSNSMDFSQNLSNLMNEAKKMQEQMVETQKSLENATVEGKAPGVKIIMTGRHNATKVEIQKSLFDEPEMLEELIAAAINDAAKKVEQLSQEQIKRLTEGLKIPTDFLKDDQAGEA